MALRDEIRQEQKKVKDLPVKERAKYIWDYYKIHILVGLIVIIALTVFIRDWVRASRPTYYSAILTNTVLDYENDIDIASDFMTFAGADPDTYNCMIDTGLQVDLERNTQMSMATEQKIMGLFSAKELDVMISPLAVTDYYAAEGAFIDMRTILTDEQIRSFEEGGYPVYEATYDGRTFPAGFYINNSPYLQKISEHGTFIPEDQPVFAFTSCITHPEAALQFLTMLTRE